MAKPSGSKASRLSAEERQLEEMRSEILRKQQELEKRLKILPAVMEQQEAQKREADRRRAASAGRAISAYPSSRTRRGRGKNLRTPSRQRTAAKIKTAALLIALAIIFFVLWNSIPV
jgi:hypothetical protein